VREWKEEKDHGGEGEKKRTHVQGKKKLEPKCVRGVNRFCVSSTLFFVIKR
jgi:hypothetical protein